MLHRGALKSQIQRRLRKPQDFTGISAKSTNSQWIVTSDNRRRMPKLENQQAVFAKVPVNAVSVCLIAAVV